MGKTIKSIKLFNTKNMTRQQWLEARQNGIGGSDASAIAGLSKWSNPIKVYSEKVDLILEKNEEEENHFMKWGNKLEHIIRENFKEDHPQYKVQKSNFMWQHPIHKFMIANVDGLIYDKEKGWGVLEIKNVSQYTSKEWNGETIPEHYLIQFQHYLAVLGLDWGHFAILIGGNEDKTWYVERDDELIDSLIQIEKAFWENHVVPEIPPEFDGSDASKTILNMLYPPEKAIDETIDLPETAGELIEQFHSAQEQEKVAKDLKDEAANKLKSFLGERTKGFYHDKKVVWSKTTSTKFDKKALAKNHPEIYEKYISKTEGRRFSIS
ncbi:YqaJ viral recombinase family protein [Peribacillus frigoritolerans]|uniref:YqaJ viral recombinase family nuclease n=1 Tax=Peribacillus frigoritolerans TaxID=450367 RepID=UPI0021D12CB6|nr:YqaJ viral recombinase family protein [Peribacillus frigoritolerans]MCU6603789.1 YqaJ viral recombinase family protein [Peribacillus frigoritolerans]